MDDKTPGMLSMPEEGSKMAGEPAMAPATAPTQGEVAKPWEGLKPVSREMMGMLTGDQVLKRQAAIGAFTKVYGGVVRDKILEFREDILEFVRRVKKKEIVIPGCDGVKEAVPATYGFSYPYLSEILRGGKKRAAPRKKKAALPDSVEEWEAWFSKLTPKQRADAMVALGNLSDRALKARAEAAKTRKPTARKAAEAKAEADEALIARGAALAEKSPEGSIGLREMRSALGVSPSKFSWLSAKAEKEGRWLRLGSSYCARSYYERLTMPNTEEVQAATRASIEESMQESFARAEAGRKETEASRLDEAVLAALHPPLVEAEERLARASGAAMDATDRVERLEQADGVDEEILVEARERQEEKEKECDEAEAAYGKAKVEAGSLLRSLDRREVIARLREAAAGLRSALEAAEAKIGKAKSKGGRTKAENAAGEIEESLLDVEKAVRIMEEAR